MGRVFTVLYLFILTYGIHVRVKDCGEEAEFWRRVWIVNWELQFSLHTLIHKQAWPRTHLNIQLSTPHDCECRLHGTSYSLLTLKYPPWYGVSGGPNIATCQMYKSSSFGKVTTNPSTGSLCRLLNSPPNLCNEVEAGVAMLADVLLAFLLV